ncbi:mitochondrial import inner membrane translocase subunit tim17 [Trypanosoma equiperdum]|uniref:Mitochondrial import inner membrane translocase subunit TIM22 n=4 Tax=Trypanozoon TaxID=39700 RepID=Q382K7_TRYB2|nr:inner membrane preprotein translocase Tim17,putative [Trypanosoma brucei gambiense DAL972]XP_829386.1 inner membrane preprotein translocase Tim17, putative [Trypanosoma brucei brucei TREU927]RHW67843.1 mitochondrial import inner membrane translocase subunit tim17 [Trypanosoma brucei equiperdum]SCU66305.1 mitochondrial import inner membrane translocase subunit tim17 [Trypanosoma equiperdum]EAN80274.1 inner membrane preprotein translocase Tim17, putative [Trypanosoma brucei brucei TREU927]CBH|eukprot:XP_011780628.1 inner membrane preprotein translocase Tim17,putative [Trypanosoma brucei gambiense DAL972]
MTTLLDPQPQIDPSQKAMMVLKDSTITPAAMNVVGGYVMGFGFSLFGAMISAESTTQRMGTADFFRYSLKTAHRLGFSFAYFGFLFGGIEVALEKRRGRKDVWNATLSGGLLGGVYGCRYYKAPGLVGGTLGGAAVSLMLERVMDALGLAQR